MYTSTFTFAKGQYDDEFYALDNIIAEVAKSIPGYLGEEAWENQETGLISNVYYWDSMEALQTLMKHPSHIQGKQRQAKWLSDSHRPSDQYVRRWGHQSPFGWQSTAAQSGLALKRQCPA